MKVYKKIIFDSNNKILYEDSYEYNGKWSRLGIHYDYNSTRSAKNMQKKARRAEKLKKKREKNQLKKGIKKEEEKTLPLSTTITLSLLTDPDKSK